MIREKWMSAAVWATLDCAGWSPGDVRNTPNWLSHRVCEPTVVDIPEAKINDRKHNKLVGMIDLEANCTHRQPSAYKQWQQPQHENAYQLTEYKKNQAHYLHSRRVMTHVNVFNEFWSFLWCQKLFSYKRFGTKVIYWEQFSSFNEMIWKANVKNISIGYENANKMEGWEKFGTMISNTSECNMN